MSNIYIQEPPSNGKVLLVTSVGDIDVELWSKEAPKACRNFVQLCMEGYYDGTIFHRVVREFIVQGGDPTGTGQGGESIYGAPFKDEFHTRLRFARRGLVAMANAGPNDNGSQFFFTMGATQELQNKHTIFGKVTGNTVFNMLKLQECETDAEERPLLPNKIIRTEILSNPYDDIIPRILKKKKDDVDKKPKSKSKATKNFKLLSFGEEAEEDEEQATKVSEGWKGKSKSSHDLANDPRLSAKPALDVSPSRLEKRKEMTDSEPEDKVEKVEKTEKAEKLDKQESPKKKLKKDAEEKPAKKVVEEKPPKKVVSPEKVEESFERKLPTKTEDLKQEAKRLKREIRESIKREEERKMETKESKDDDVKEEAAPASNDPLADFKKERLKYKSLRKQQGKKGSEREQITLAILDKFKSKLDTTRKLASAYSDDEKEEEEEEEEDVTDMSWMHHKLQFEEQKKKVIDANVSDLDRYEIHDPRNPLTKRRRETSKQVMKERR